MDYLLQTTIIWAVFALLYYLILRRETFFRLNRWYLLVGLFAGLLLPHIAACQWSAITETTDLYALQLPAAVVGVHHYQVLPEAVLGSIIVWLYWLGAGLGAFRLLAGLWGLWRLINSAERIEKVNGFTYVYSSSLNEPCSFLRWIFLPAESEMEAPVLAHEETHVHEWHSVDVLFIELLDIFYWFHPMIYWYRKQLRQVHEYLADAEASRTISRKQYGLLLIRQAQSGKVPAFTHHFYHSPLKQRLIMLSFKKSPAIRQLKYVLVLPLFALAFWYCSKIESLTDSQSAIQTSKVEERRIESTSEAQSIAKSGKAEERRIYGKLSDPNNDSKAKELFDVDQQPEFPGGMDQLLVYLAQNIKYPEAAQKAKLEGKVAVQFIIEKDGAISNVIVLKEIGNGCGDEAARVVAAMPKWTPALKDGAPVRVKFTLPVQFRLE